MQQLEQSAWVAEACITDHLMYPQHSKVSMAGASLAVWINKLGGSPTPPQHVLQIDGGEVRTSNKDA
jgi:hypothetical protein